MAIIIAAKKKLAIFAIVLAVGGGAFALSAEACYRGDGYGWTGAAYPAAAGYGWRDGGWGWRGAGWGWRGVGFRGGFRR